MKRTFAQILARAKTWYHTACIDDPILYGHPIDLVYAYENALMNALFLAEEAEDGTAFLSEKHSVPYGIRNYTKKVDECREGIEDYNSNHGDE